MDVLSYIYVIQACI